MSNYKIRKQANSINPPRTVSFSLSAGAVLVELANEPRFNPFVFVHFWEILYHLISHDAEHGQPATQKPPCRK